MKIVRVVGWVCVVAASLVGAAACASSDGGGVGDGSAGSAGGSASGGTGGGGGGTKPGGSGGGSDVTPGTMRTLEDYYAPSEARERAWCKYYDDCCVPEDKDSYTRIFCPTTVQTAAEQAAETQKDIDAGEHGFDGRFVDACLADTEAQILKAPKECSGPLGPAADRDGPPSPIRSFGQSAACRAMFPGKKKEGEKCTWDIPCAAPLACRKVGADYQCAKPGAKGEACDVLDGDCATGLSCLGKRCLPSQSIGGECSSSSDCGEGLVCGFPDSKFVCVSAKGQGEDCKDDLEACEEGLFCNFANTKCSKPAPVGASCDLGCAGRCDKKTNTCTTVCGGTFFLPTSAHPRAPCPKQRRERPPVSEELYAFVQPERAGGRLGEKAAALVEAEETLGVQRVTLAVAGDGSGNAAASRSGNAAASPKERRA